MTSKQVGAVVKRLWGVRLALFRAAEADPGFAPRLEALREALNRATDQGERLRDGLAGEEARAADKGDVLWEVFDPEKYGVRSSIRATAHSLTRTYSDGHSYCHAVRDCWLHFAAATGHKEEA